MHAKSVGLTLNGENHEFSARLTVRDLLTLLSLHDRGVALVVNGAVCPRSCWDTIVRDGWDVEAFMVVQGG